ncbi:LuxR C-terminal-related transcriptional regulator [Alcaligenaceae bacterium CGII-47]|nr:LuxR C-terminal-related transcriptional regulator [Alcaligenaceae bacterium CGII-47]
MTLVFEIHDCARSPFNVLTRRERDVLAHVVMGKQNKVIAAELDVTQRTVEAHRARIFEKMKVRNAVELTHRYLGWQQNASRDEAAAQ